jgi:ribosomal-protein-alanine N-acetyltransferase
MNSIQLETPRLSLRLMRLSDIDGLLGIFGDPLVMASFNTTPFNQDQMSNWVQRNLDHQDVHGYGLFSVILKSEELLIGDCGLEHMEVEGEQTTELGYDFNSNYWNQGYATEAGQAVRDYAFDVLHLPHLISLIRVGNEASRRVSEKIGMQCETEFTTNGIKYWKYTMNSGTDEKNSVP